MADQAEDVLELEDAAVVENDEAEDIDLNEHGEGDDEAGETSFVFTDEAEAAPASESESSVIRDLRKANRELARKLAKVDQASQPKPIEVGPKPVLSDCGDEGYDEEVFEREIIAWNARKAAAEHQAKDAEERQAKADQEWQERAETYKAAKVASRIAGIDEAEEIVLAALPENYVGAIMRNPETAPKLIAALANSPSKLDELSKLDALDAAMMIGELKGSVQMTTRKRPSPDAPLRGSAAFSGGTDKQLARLEKDAERTGDRTALIRYRRNLAA